MSFTGDVLCRDERAPLLDPENRLLGPKHALFGQSMEVNSSCLGGESSVCRFMRWLWCTLTGKRECPEEREKPVTEKRQDVVMSLLFCEAMMKMRRSHEKKLQELGKEGVKKRMFDFMYGGSDSDWLTESEWTVSQKLESVVEESTSSSARSSRDLASDDPGSFYDFSDDDDEKSGSHSMEFFSPQAKSPLRKSIELISPED